MSLQPLITRRYRLPDWAALLPRRQAPGAGAREGTGRRTVPPRRARRAAILQVLCLGLAIAFAVKAEFSLVFPDRLATAEKACEEDTSSEQLESKSEVDLVSTEASLDDFSLESTLAARVPVSSRLLCLKPQRSHGLLLRGPPAMGV